MLHMKLLILSKKRYKIPKSSETSARFDINTLKVRYKQTLIKMRKLILSGQEYPNLGIFGLYFCKQMLKSLPLK